MSPVVTTHSDGTPAVAYALADGAGRMLAARDPHTVFYSASTVKLGVMLAAVLAAERRELGAAGLDAELECRHEFVCGGSEETFVLDPDDRDELFPPDGSRASMAELVRMMIVRSSNEATNVLFDRLGAPRVAEAFALCGAASTRMERRIGDPCAIGAGLTNETTPADLVAIMRCLVTGAGGRTSGDGGERVEGGADDAIPGPGADGAIARPGAVGAIAFGSADSAMAYADADGAIRDGRAGGVLTTPEHAAWMRGVLQAQEHARIGAVVAAGVTWGSKSGDVPGIEHDVAYVGDGATRRYLAVCTRGYEPEQGREAIRAVAQALLR